MKRPGGSDPAGLISCLFQQSRHLSSLGSSTWLPIDLSACYSSVMELFRRNPISTASGGLTSLSAFLWMAEQWLPQQFVAWGLAMPWGWMTAILFAFWVGGQVNQLSEGRHWTQAKLKSRAFFVEFGEAKRQKSENGVKYVLDLRFTKHVKNIQIVVETFRAEMSFIAKPWSWYRFRATTALNRADCNKGSTERISLLELQVEETATSTAKPFNALAPNLPVPPVHARGRFMVRVTVAASGYEPLLHEKIFLWEREELFPMPLEVPMVMDGDSTDFAEGRCTLRMQSE